ncbi:nuclease-related domain-containing protein [Microbacterium sp. NPDC008134]|uniref:nuclease-related domain-containing protein n=1 Tax=Microbacterium sp. NPDC008134 TaxID=3364183 RepID=UPI0036E79AAA
MSHLPGTYGARGRVGAAGENYFARGLKRAGLTKFEVFYSLNIPDVPGKARMRGDIDCVIANGAKVVLIDVKRWAGSWLWTIPGTDKPLNGFLPYSKDGEWGLSKNMITALDRMRLRLPEADISAMVVFVPTKNHDPESVPRSVDFLIWPGMIRSYISGHAFGELNLRLGNEVVDVPPSALHLLTQLKRN